MKRIISLITTGVVILSMFAGCGQKAESNPNPTENPIENETGTENKNENENVEIPNPFTTYETLDDARKDFGADFLVPEALPEGFSQNSISIGKAADNTFAQVIYTSGEGKITYRVGEGTQELNGDFNQYDNHQTILVRDLSIETNGNADTISNASWENDGYSYWISATPALTIPEFTSLVESIK